MITFTVSWRLLRTKLSSRKDARMAFSTRSGLDFILFSCVTSPIMGYTMTSAVPHQSIALIFHLDVHRRWHRGSLSQILFHRRQTAFRSAGGDKLVLFFFQ